jgi:hypothetical protein
MIEMTKEEAELMLDVVSGVVGISIAEHQRPGVIQNLQAAASMAELTFSVPLAEFDPAPVFVPVEP